jgi:hypothetical protein
MPQPTCRGLWPNIDVSVAEWYVKFCAGGEVPDYSHRLRTEVNIIRTEEIIQAHKTDNSAHVPIGTRSCISQQ